MLYVEGGDNGLDVETFRTFPRLEELHLQVNHVTDLNVTHNDFVALKRLDLSYNQLRYLSVDSIINPMPICLVGNHSWLLYLYFM